MFHPISSHTESRDIFVLIVHPSIGQDGGKRDTSALRDSCRICQGPACVLIFLLLWSSDECSCCLKRSDHDTVYIK